MSSTALPDSVSAEDAAKAMKRAANIAADDEKCKKAKTSHDEGSEGSASPKPNDKTTTPHGIYFAALKSFMNEKNFLGYKLVKGIPAADSDDEEEDEDEENDTSKYTKEQMNSLRFVMATQARADQFEEMRQLILGDQADSCFMSFSTSFSYHILDTWRIVKNKLKSLNKTPAKKLDLLLAYTFMLKENDVWMHDNEGGMDELVKGLAGAWKRFLKSKSDEELGWDLEYTKPGVMELLRQFKEAIDNMDDCYDMGTFQYK